MKNACLAVCSLLALGALFAPAHAEVCNVSIDANDSMQFDRKEVHVKATCTDVTITLKHTGKLPAAAMGHNWVLTRTADFQAVASAGINAVVKENYVPKGDKRVIAHTRIVGGGESASVNFKTAQLKRGDAYTFFCSFPGHWAVMQGKLIFG